MKPNRLFPFFLLLFSCALCGAQPHSQRSVLRSAEGHLPSAGRNNSQFNNFFVDGFHGGLYGHYPLDTYTQFIVDQLEQYPDWYVGLEIEPETWDSVAVRTPEAYRRFKEKIIGPQVEVTNPTYAQPYLYNISGESIIRQFQYGMEKLRHHFPGLSFTTYSSEEPCFTSQLPQLLRLFGFKYVSLKCPDTCWGGYTEAYGGQLVSLVGPDGTAMLAVPRYGCEDLQEGSVWQTIAWTNSDAFLTACREAGIQHPVGMCYQDAGWTYGPWLRDRKGSTQYVRWTDYIEQLTPQHTDDEWHWSQEDLHPALMWGTQVLQRIARQVRQAENHLVQAEKLAAIMGEPLPKDSVDEAWRTLMLAQHHDSWIVPYNGLRGYGTWADAIRQWTDFTSSFALRHLGAGEGRADDELPADKVASDKGASDKGASPLASGAGGALMVYNTTGHARHEVIEVEGHLMEVDVPAFGCAPLMVNSQFSIHNSQFTIHNSQFSIHNSQFSIHNSQFSIHNSQFSTHNVLENDCYRICFDLEHGGTISSLVDKSSGRELVDAQSERRFLELRGHFPQLGGFSSSAEHRARLTWLLDEPLRQQVRIDGEVAGVPFSQTITLTKGEPRIDCHLHIDWSENTPVGEGVRSKRNDRRTPFYDTRYMLRLFFPAALQSPRLSKDAPFDVCESRLVDSYFNRWDSIRHNIVLNWVDLSEGTHGNGLALLTDHTTSYTYGHDEPLSLTVQYSGPGLWWRNYPIDGPTDISYALVPHQGNWEEAGLPHILENYQSPLRVVCHTSPRGVEDFSERTGGYSLLSTDFQVSAAILQPDGSLLLRLFNASRHERTSALRLNMPVSEVVETDLDGHEIRRYVPDREGVVNLQMPRFGIKNLVVR